MTHFSSMDIRYFPPFLSASSWVRIGPMYSIIRLSYGIGSKANNPRPVTVRLIAYLGFPLGIGKIVARRAARGKRKRGMGEAEKRGSGEAEGEGHKRVVWRRFGE